jgi:hypothetical protein
MANQYQERYWKELFQLKVHTEYLEIYLTKTEFRDKAVNMFLGITSSSSICGWAIWQQYSFIWGLIIASSQLVNAIKIFLPYKNRLKSLSGIRHEFNELMIFGEMKWYDVSEGNLTEEDINKLQYEIRNKKISILKKYLGSEVLPENKKYFANAQDLATTYFNNFYPKET